MTSASGREAAVAVGLTLLAVAIGWWWLGSRAEAEAAAPAAGSEEEGRALFLTGCSSCHGQDGEGVTTSDGDVRGPSIQESGEAGAYFQLSTGRMPLGNGDGPSERKRPAYDDDEIAALVAYVGSLGDGPELPEVDIEDADLAEGGEVFLASCAACHSASGAGGALSYGQSAPGLGQAEPLEVATALRSGPGEMPVFGPEELDQEELDAVTRYVQYLRDPDDRGGLAIGRIGPVPEGFVALTFGIGVLLAAVAWIGTRSPIPGRQEEGIDD